MGWEAADRDAVLKCELLVVFAEPDVPALTRDGEVAREYPVPSSATEMPRTWSSS